MSRGARGTIELAASLRGIANGFRERRRVVPQWVLELRLENWHFKAALTAA